MHSHKMIPKADSGANLLCLPRLSQPHEQHGAAHPDPIDSRLRAISTVNLKKAKLKYPFTERKHSVQVDHELARMQRRPSVDLSSSGESRKILQDFMKDDIDETRGKEELVMLRKVEAKATLPKGKFTQEKLVGEEAVRVFYDRYKNINRVMDREVYYGQQNPITFILSILDAYNLPPKRMEIIKLRGSDAILDLRNCGIGKGPTGRIVSELVSQLGQFEEIDLSFNEITQDAVEVLIPKLGILRSVCLSHNKIGKLGCQLLSNLFRNPECKIRDLELESNFLNEMIAIPLLENLVTYNRLRLLNLSKNLLSNAFAFKLKKYLLEDECLEELYLHWNEFTDKGGKYIFDGLASHKALRVLDISWNDLTGREAVSSICTCTPSISTVFKENKVLLHLDLSFCDFNGEESQRLSAALELNNTIYGMHFEGNMGYVNHRGGLVCEPGLVIEYPIPIRRGILRRIRGLGLSSDRNEFKSTHKQDVCWICQGWQEVEFRIDRPAGFAGECFLHLDFESFGAVKMEDEKAHFAQIRMCPVGDVRFYFTLTPPTREVSSSCHEVSETPLPSKPGLSVNWLKVEWTEELFQEDFTVGCRCVPRSEVHVIPHFK